MIFKQDKLKHLLVGIGISLVFGGAVAYMAIKLILGG